jgi:Rrf2 family nitric oxide-sensitive transcriptional repressor
MRLRTFTDYCLRVLIYVALDPARRATIGEIAAAFDVSENHLMKVVRFLARNRLLTSVRGRGGGLTLARPAVSISIAEVVRAAECGSAPAECFERSTNCCVITPACRLRHVLDEAMEAFYAVLARYTLADLVARPRELARLLSLAPVVEIPLDRIAKRRARR